MGVHAKQMVIALAVAATLGACGGDDGDGGGDTGGGVPAAAAKRPQPKEPVDATVARLRPAVEGGDCKERAELFLHSGHKGPGEPLVPSREQCAKYEEFSKFLDGFEPSESREYGTAAVVEGKTAKSREGETVSGLWVLDKGGAWKGIFFGTSRTPQVGQSPPDPAAFDRAAQNFFQAARDRDCGQLFKRLTNDSQYVTARGNDETKFCADLDAAYERRTGQLFDIAEHGTKAPERLGQTRDLGFYGLDLGNGRYITLVVAAAPAAEDTEGHDNPAVYDFLTARDPR